MAIVFPATRWSLIARIAEQPLQSRTVLALYVDAIGAYLAAKLRDQGCERSDDVIQDVLVELLDKPELIARATPGGGSRFRHWLMHIAWHAALNRLRYYQRRNHPSLSDHEQDHAVAPDAPADDRTMDRAWALSVVQQAFDEAHSRLSDQTGREAMQVLRQHLLTGESLRDIAAATGMPLATCSRRLALARQAVQRAIADRLRFAGELSATDDDLSAGARLLESLRDG